MKKGIASQQNAAVMLENDIGEEISALVWISNLFSSGINDPLLGNSIYPLPLLVKHWG